MTRIHTTFAADAIGTVPAGFTHRQGSGAAVASFAGATGGKVVSLSPSYNRVLLASNIGQTADLSITVKMRATSDTFSDPALWLRADGAGNGYAIHPQSGGWVLRKYLNGTIYNVHNSMSWPTFTANAWWIVQAVVVGQDIFWRALPEDQTGVTGAQRIAWRHCTDPTYASGYFGIGSTGNGAGTISFDVVTIDTETVCHLYPNRPEGFGRLAHGGVFGLETDNLLRIALPPQDAQAGDLLCMVTMFSGSAGIIPITPDGWTLVADFVTIENVKTRCRVYERIHPGGLLTFSHGVAASGSVIISYAIAKAKHAGVWTAITPISVNTISITGVNPPAGAILMADVGLQGGVKNTDATWSSPFVDRHYAPSTNGTHTNGGTIDPPDTVSGTVQLLTPPEAAPAPMVGVLRAYTEDGLEPTAPAFRGWGVPM